MEELLLVSPLLEHVFGNFLAKDGRVDTVVIEGDGWIVSCLVSSSCFDIAVYIDNGYLLGQVSVIW